MLVLGAVLGGVVGGAHAVGEQTAPAPGASSTGCAFDRARLLALDEHAFDQDMAGGWRTLAEQPGCKLVAADLLRDYRQAHGNEAGLLYWHEAQLRAMAGQSEAAIALMERSRRPAGKDKGGWNPYVDASIAFLRKDRAALGKARQDLASVPYPDNPDMPPLKNGVVEMPMEGGTSMKMRWPPNIDVVDGFIGCFDKPYEVAYNNGCRPPAP